MRLIKKYHMLMLSCLLLVIFGIRHIKLHGVLDDNHPYSLTDDVTSDLPGRGRVLEFCHKKLTEEMDIMSQPPLNFSPKFKNPCWYSSEKLYCLPYFIIAGVAKCGTTDLFGKIVSHPEVIGPRQKEPRWFTNNRFFRDESLMSYSRSNFDKLARILSTTTGTKNASFITGEGTVTNAEGPWFWELLPANVGRREPVHTNAHIMRHLIPDARIIFTLRNPVERLWSEYLAFSRADLQSSEIFHQLVSRAIPMYERCLATTPIRGCMYNKTLFELSTMNETEIQRHPDGCNITPQNIVSIRRGVYHVFIRDFMEAFPSNQVLIIRLEDLADDPISVMKQVYRFLNLSQMDSSLEMKLGRAKVKNPRKSKRRNVDPMWPETRDLLLKFYKEHNRQLAELLHDSKFNYGPL